MDNPKDPLERAKADAARNRQQAQRCREQANQLDREADRIEAFIEKWPTYMLQDAPSAIRRRGGKADIIAAEVTEYLRERNGPAHLSEIFTAMKAKGVDVGGSDEKAQRNNLAGYLSRDKSRFSHDRIRGWWFAHENDDRQPAAPDDSDAASPSHAPTDQENEGPLPAPGERSGP